MNYEQDLQTQGKREPQVPSQLATLKMCVTDVEALLVDLEKRLCFVLRPLTPTVSGLAEKETRYDDALTVNSGSWAPAALDIRDLVTQIGQIQLSMRHILERLEL